MQLVFFGNNSGPFLAKNKHHAPYKKQKATRRRMSFLNLMTDLDQKHTSNEQITVHILRIKPRH